MESLTRVKSLQELIEQLLPSTKASVASPSPASTPSLPDRESLQHTLVKLVSERTGYPPEMLGIEQDLEAELGIDSIKRVEILGALQSNLPESLATRIQQQMESLTRVKSLQELIEQLLLVPTPVKEESSLGKQWG
jgi:acyl carrier protein